MTSIRWLARLFTCENVVSSGDTLRGRDPPPVTTDAFGIGRACPIAVLTPAARTQRRARPPHSLRPAFVSCLVDFIRVSAIHSTGDRGSLQGCRWQASWRFLLSASKGVVSRVFLCE